MPHLRLQSVRVGAYVMAVELVASVVMFVAVLVLFTVAIVVGLYYRR